MYVLLNSQPTTYYPMCERLTDHSYLSLNHASNPRYSFIH